MNKDLPETALTLNHPDYQFLLEIASFLQYGMIAKSVIKKHLSWLHHLYVTPGNVKDKLDQLPKLEIGAAIQTQLDGLYKAPSAKLLSNVNLIEGFNQLLQYYIQDIEQHHYHIKSYKQQRNFVITQLKVESITHTFSFLKPLNDASKKQWIKSIERLYQIIQRLYYLANHDIGEVYFGFDPTKYTVLQPDLAKALQIPNSYKPLDHVMSHTNSISFYGPKNILPFITDHTCYLLPDRVYEFHFKLLHRVTLPAKLKASIITEVAQLLKILRKLAIQHHLQSKTLSGITEEN